MTATTPVTIWGYRDSSNVMKVLWTCAELDIPHELIETGGARGYDHVPDYAARNPNRRVPTIAHEGLVLWESNVIVRYLCTAFGRGTLWPAEPARRWEAEKWMDWKQTTLRQPMVALYGGLVRGNPAYRDPAVLAAAREKAAAAWALLDAHLAGRPYLAGDTLTMADIPPCAEVHRWFGMDIERPHLPHLAAWYGRLAERAAYRTHVMRPFLGPR